MKGFLKVAIGVLVFGLFFQINAFAQQNSGLRCGDLGRLWGQWCVFTNGREEPVKLIPGQNIYHPVVWRQDGKVHMLVGGWKDAERQNKHDQIFRFVSDDYRYGISGWRLYKNLFPYIGNDWDQSDEIPRAKHTVQPSLLLNNDFSGYIYYAWDPYALFPEKGINIHYAYLNRDGSLRKGVNNPLITFGEIVPECDNATVQAVSNGHIFFDPASGKYYFYYVSWFDERKSSCAGAITSVAVSDRPDGGFVTVVKNLFNGMLGASPFVVRGKDGKYYIFFTRWLAPPTAEIRVRVGDSPLGPFPYATERTVLKIPEGVNTKLRALLTPYVFCNEQVNRWQMYFAGHTDRITDNQIYTAFSPLGFTCEDPPVFSASNNPVNTPTPTPTPVCLKDKGDANCDGKIDNADYNLWRCEYLNDGTCSGMEPERADFNSDGKVSLIDFEILRRNI